MSYYKRVFRRAWEMTRSDFRLVQVRPALIKAALGGAVIAILVMLEFPGMADKTGYAAIAALVFVAGFSGVLLINLLLAPSALHSEAEETIARLGKQLDDKEAREAALKVLWELRKDGVALRNEPVTSVPMLLLWVERAESWRKDVLLAAGSVNINLRYYLEILNEVGDPPTMRAFDNTHGSWIKIMSEILRRLEGFLCKTL